MVPRSAKQRLLFALALTSGFMVVEWVVGLVSGSLALIADAGHMLGDAGALFIALVAQQIAGAPRTHRRTYGGRRAEVIAAFANGIALAFTAVWIFAQAVSRLRSPVPVASVAMLVTAAAGLVVNLLVASILAHEAHEHGHDHDHAHNPNVRAALLHVLSDAVGSVGAVVAAIVVLTTGLRSADTIVGVLIALLVLASAWKLIRDTTRVLMESSPSKVSLAELEATIRAVGGVADLHDLHAWTISSGFDVVTVHVVLAPGHHGVEIADRVASTVRAVHGIEHVTVQPEAPPAPLVSLRVRPPNVGRAS